MERIKIIVKTNAGKNEILKFDEEKKAYRVNVKTIPEKGKANLEIIKLFHKKLKKQVKMVSGFKSKEKVLEIS
ncbi:MAG: YggU family protein [Nanoarchaeota archaeon]|nr:YggU family protein [Nanoarchaeota archaeon]MBU4241842.1 YggU family protein [Nanoarchaeota archaeon]MBU4351881.1 YggU family protein [Nanoarchaeota archaeon]MBU4456102.1 YggU family protein [Nanoarchaeota archaeon]MCG2719754.1 DUF167 family protein [Nanoarchaeota archaeon]